jgi:hypothetical protein
MFLSSLPDFVPILKLTSAEVLDYFHETPLRLFLGDSVLQSGNSFLENSG